VKKLWKYRLPDDFRLDLKKYIGPVKDCLFYDYVNYKEIPVGHIKNGILTIFKGYEWDGCTPKFKLFGKLFGVPDFPATWIPSLIHDFLIEYFLQHHIYRETIDILFEKLLKERKFKLAGIYANAVHLFRIVRIRI
jgi:hypothetical protein